MPRTLQFIFPLKNGFHARPASAFQDLANRFASTITLVNEGSGACANGKSTLALVGTMTKQGDACTVRIDGTDAEQAADALRRFLDEQLPHCDDDLPVPASMAGGHLPHLLRANKIPVLRGISVSPGIARAPVHSVHARALTLPASAIRAGSTAEEIERLRHALQTLEARLRARPVRRGAEAEVARAHLSIITDVEFQAELEGGITAGGLSAGQAVIHAAERYVALLAAADSEYLRERVVDIRDVASQIMDAAYGAPPEAADMPLTADAIVVADDLTPSQFMALDKRYLRGLALAHAGATSHTVIVARSLGIPTVIGVPDAALHIPAGETLVLDAVRGILVADPQPDVRAFYDAEVSTQEQIARRLRVHAGRTAATADGKRIEVAANAASVEEAEKAFRDGAEGIGLFRTEMLFMDRSAPPTEEEQYAVYAATMRAAEGRPVIFRTLDIGGDKGVEYLGLPEEENPFLGYRAVRLYPAFREMIDAQLRALLRASAIGKAKIMVPMIASVTEVRAMREWIERIKGELAAAKVPFDPAIGIGIMVEIPSVAFQMDQLAPLVDFFSIGSNDLTQYFLAVDRGNPKVRGLYSSFAPSFLRLLKMITDGAHRHGRWVGLCGELGGKCEAVPLFLGLGLDEISLASPGIPAMKDRIAAFTVSEGEALLNEVAGFETPDEVERTLAAAAGGRLAGRPLIDGNIIVLGSDNSTKDTVIRELVNTLYADGRMADPDAVEDAVWRREETYSTGIGFGVAIPHCKSGAVHSSSIAFLRPAMPFLWADGDDEPVTMVILLAINDAAPDDAHLRIIAMLSRRLMHDEFRQKLLDAPSAADVVAALSEAVG
jgi:multiphosphoryl transfer protein